MMIYFNNGTERLSERELLQRYRDDLDETNGEIRIGNLTFLPSRVLEEIDLIAFQLGFSKWTDAEGWEDCSDDGQ